MLKQEPTSRYQRVVCGLIALVLFGSANAKSLQPEVTQPRKIDVVIALDVSNSMDGLIDSAKQRLWDIVNELGRAQPQPELRMAILSYGNPEYGIESGFVRVNLPFTNDLDAVNRTLFEFQTNGGDEYVARAVDTALEKLSWSQDPGALRVIFVVGNESAFQDPQISASAIATIAASRGIIINTIYCGNESDPEVLGWRQVAAATNGLFASIDQNAAAVANIATPMDEPLAELNKELNETYIAFGRAGAKSRKNQLEQDANAASMSAPAMASRTAAKATSLYTSDSWDLVAAVESGTVIEEVEAEDLPAEMKDMDASERVAFIEQKSKKREEIQGRIRALADERQNFIKIERARTADDDVKGLDQVITSGLRSQAEEKGFTFDGTE